MAIFFFSKWRLPPSWVLLLVKIDVIARCGLYMSTTVPNLVTISQPAAELLRFVEKFKMAASAILNLCLSILDHPRSLHMDLKRHSKFDVNRTTTFQDIAILIFLKFSLKRLFRPPLLRPPKDTSLAGSTRFEPSLVAVRRALRPGR